MKCRVTKEALLEARKMLEKTSEYTTFYDGILRIICGKECKEIFLDAENDTPVSLKDCYEIFAKTLLEEGDVLTITVIYEDWTHGDIYRYGNHGEYWEKIGETVGFA